MPNGYPKVPNYVPGVGILTTTRLDFEDHVIGTKFRHSADQIDVLLQNSPPGLLIEGQYYTTVLTALQALVGVVEPPVLSPATQAALGTIQLTRDLGGTNGLSPKVIGLQGFPVSSQTPVTNNVLTWNGSSWIPQVLSGSFVPGGDLGGFSPTSSTTLQYVSSLTGNSGTVSILANNLTFSSSVVPNVSQTSVGSGTGQSFNISAQSVTGTGTGGSLILQGGNVASGLNGSTVININGQAAFQVGQVVSGNNVAAFFPGTLTATKLPANSGNGVIYVANATSVPTTGTPVGGAVLYATNGQLWIKQSDATNFQIGNLPDPSVWTSLPTASLPSSPTIPANGALTYNVVATSGVSVAVNAFTFIMPVSTSVRFDTTYVGKETGTGNTAQYNYSIGFVRNGSGAPAAVGTVTSTDARSVGGSWTAPSTTAASYISGNNISIPTGSSSAVGAVWTVITKVTITTA
jgi:hypothetical protein